MDVVAAAEAAAGRRSRCATTPRLRPAELLADVEPDPPRARVAPGAVGAAADRGGRVRRGGVIAVRERAERNIRVHARRTRVHERRTRAHTTASLALVHASPALRHLTSAFLHACGVSGCGGRVLRAQSAQQVGGPSVVVACT